MPNSYKCSGSRAKVKTDVSVNIKEILEKQAEAARPVPNFSTPMSPREPPPRFPESQLGTSMFPQDMGSFPDNSVALRDDDNDDYDDYDRAQLLQQQPDLTGFGFVDDAVRPRAYLVHKVFDQVKPGQQLQQLLHHTPVFGHLHHLGQPAGGLPVSCHTQAASSCAAQSIQAGCQPQAVSCHIGSQASEVFVSERELWVPKADGKKVDGNGDKKKMKRGRGSSRRQLRTGGNTKKKIDGNARPGDTKEKMPREKVSDLPRLLDLPDLPESSEDEDFNGTGLRDNKRSKAN